VLAHAKEQSTALKVFDVFEMIPEPSERDDGDVIDRYNVIKSGESKGIGGEGLYNGYEKELVRKVEDNFRQNDIELAVEKVDLVQGGFNETLAKERGALSFAHIDCDWFDSAMICFVELWSRLSPGGSLVSR
jgi:asparagine synthase (glutamine-hydrolysing)